MKTCEITLNTAGALSKHAKARQVAVFVLPPTPSWRDLEAARATAALARAARTAFFVVHHVATPEDFAPQARGEDGIAVEWRERRTLALEVWPRDPLEFGALRGGSAVRLPLQRRGRDAQPPLHRRRCDALRPRTPNLLRGCIT